MKTAQSEQNFYIINAFIERALEKYSLEEITSCFLSKITNWKDRDKIVNELLKDEEVKYELNNKLEDEFMKGKFVVAIETQDQEIKLKDFICENIYPYYNQQQTQLFA